MAARRGRNLPAIVSRFRIKTIRRPQQLLLVFQPRQENIQGPRDVLRALIRI